MPRLSLRVFGVLVKVLLVGAMLVVGTPYRPQMAEAAPPEPPPQPRTEVVANRTTHSKTYQLDDGTFETELFAQPVHYADESTSTLLVIDPSLDETLTAKGKEYRTRANNFTVSLPENITSRWVSVESTQGRVAFRPASRVTLPEAALAATVKAERRGKGATRIGYPGAFRGAELEYTATNDSIKETIVLEKFSGTNVFSFDLVTEGVTPKMNERGGIDFVSGDGTTTVFEIAPPWMEDSSQGPEGEPAFSDAVHYEILPGILGWRLDVVADRSWLTDPARVYPVKIDPTITYAWISRAYATDTVFCSNQLPNYNYHWVTEGGMWPLKVGLANKYYYRSFVRSEIVSQVFDAMRDYDRDINILYARLGLQTHSATPNPMTVRFNKINSAWNADTLTWNNQPATESIGSFSAVAGQTTDLHVTQLVQGWLDNPGTNHGVMLWADSTAGYSKYYAWDVSSEGVPGAYHPYFRIAWTTVPKVSILSPVSDTLVSGQPTVVWDYDDDRHRIGSNGKLVKKPQHAIEIELKDRPGGTLLKKITKTGYEERDYTITSEDYSGWEAGKRYFVRMRASGMTDATYGQVWSNWTDWAGFTYASPTSVNNGAGVEAGRASEAIGAGAAVELASGALVVEREELAGPARGSGALALGTVYRSDAPGTTEAFAPGFRLPKPTLTRNDQRAPDPAFNLLPGASGGWFVSAGGASVTRVSGGTSGTCLQFDSSSYTNAFVASSVANRDAMLPVYPGQKLHASAYFKAGTGFAADRNTGSPSEFGGLVKIHFYNADGGYIGQAASGNYTMPPATYWRQMTLDVPAPKDAHFAKMNIEYKNAQGILLVDDALFADAATVFVDADGTTRTLAQAGDGRFVRDPLTPGVGLELENVMQGARVSASVPGDNVAPDPGLDKSLSAAGWVVSNTAITAQQSTVKRSGAGALRFTSSSFANGYVATSDTTTAKMYAVTPGQSLRSGLWVNTSGFSYDTSKSEGGALIKVHFYDSAGAYKGVSQSANWAQATTNGWRELSHTCTVPSGVAYAKFNIEYRWAKGTLWVDDVEFGRGAVLSGKSVDGDASRSSLSYDSVVANANGSSYLEYDLGRLRALNELVLDLWDYEEYPTFGYKISVSADKTSWSEVVPATEGAHRKHYRFDPVRARYVRVYALSTLRSGTFRLHEISAPRYELGNSLVALDSTGRVVATGDESDNMIKRTYTSGRLSRLADDAGRRIDLVYDGQGKLASLDWTGIDSAGVTKQQAGRVSYSFQGETLTVSYNEGSGAYPVAHYRYNASGRIDRITDADGVAMDIAYGGGGKVSHVTYADGTVKRFAYVSSGVVDVSTESTSGADSLKTRVNFDAATQRVTSITKDPQGEALSSSVAYDCYGNVRSVIDPMNRKTTSVADGHGNVIRTDQAGIRQTSARYEDDLMVEARDAKDNLSTFQYDAARRMLSSSTAISDAPADDDGGEAATFDTYDSYGNQTTGNLPGSTSVNLLLNAQFESDPTVTGNDWDGPRSGVILRPVSITHYLGKRYVRLSDPDNSSYITSDKIAVDPERAYVVSAWTRGNGMLRVLEYNKSGAFLRTRWPVMFTGGTGQAFTRVAGMYWPTDSNVAKIEVRPFAYAGDTADIDNVRLEMANGAGHDNFLDNASFEVTDGPVPKRWTVRSSSRTNAKHETLYDLAVSGVRSIRIETFANGESGYFYSNKFPVRSGEAYSASAYIRHAKVTGKAYVDIMWYDSADNMIKRDRVATTEGSASFKEWRRYVANVTVPQEAVEARFDCELDGGGGIARFDALSLEPVKAVEVIHYDPVTSTFNTKTDSTTGRRSGNTFDDRGRHVDSTYAEEPNATPVVVGRSHFDDKGRLARVESFPTSGFGIEASFDYSAGGRLTSVSDPLGNETEMAYDAAGRPFSVTDPLGLRTKTSYDSLGRVDQVLRPAQSVEPTIPLMQYLYDTVGRQSGIVYFDESGTPVETQTATYDKNSNPVSESRAGSSHSVTRTFDVLNRLKALQGTGPAGSYSLSTTYDVADLPEDMSWTVFGASRKVVNTFAKTNQRQTTKFDGDPFTWYFAFDVTGKTLRTTSGLGSQLKAYDPAGRLTSTRLGKANGSSVSEYAFQQIGYDSWERISSRSIDFAGPGDAADSYTYDAAGRLQTWNRTGTVPMSASYTFDAAANLKTKSQGGVTSTFDYNEVNQLVSETGASGVMTHEYDELGRLVRSSSAAGESTYAWNALGQLGQIGSSEGTSTYEYGIDGMRQRKVVATSSGTRETKSLWDGMRLLSERDSDGTRYDYLYGPGGVPLELVKTAPGTGGATSRYAFQVDAGGSVIGLTDENGAEVARYAYDPYGVVFDVAGSDLALANRNPLRYRGYYLDTETGLYYLPARYYDPARARFLSVDPAAPSANDPASLNRYSYCFGDPVNWTDTTGAAADWDGDGKQSQVDYYAQRYVNDPTPENRSRAQASYAAHTAARQPTYAEWQREQGAQLEASKNSGAAMNTLFALLEPQFWGISADDLNFTLIGPRGVGVTVGQVTNHPAGWPSDRRWYAGIALGSPGSWSVSAMACPNYIEPGQRYMEVAGGVGRFAGAGGFRSSPKQGENGLEFPDRYLQGGTMIPAGASLQWYYVW